MKLVAYLKTGPTASHAGGWRPPAAALHDIAATLRRIAGDATDQEDIRESQDATADRSVAAQKVAAE